MKKLIFIFILFVGVNSFSQVDGLVYTPVNYNVLTMIEKHYNGIGKDNTMDFLGYSLNHKEPNKSCYDAYYDLINNTQGIKSTNIKLYYCAGIYGTRVTDITANVYSDFNYKETFIKNILGNGFNLLVKDFYDKYLDKTCDVYVKITQHVEKVSISSSGNSGQYYTFINYTPQ